jgi:TatD DNase family protein
MWVDSHCHLDASEFDEDRDVVRDTARLAGVSLCLIPAVERTNFLAVQAAAHRYQDWYALGIHPLYVPQAADSDLTELRLQIERLKNDLRLVAVGEIGLDYFVPSLCTEAMRARQWQFYVDQLRLAKEFDLPVILHVRKSADQLLQGLGQIKNTKGGIAHAFNGSLQQAHRFIDCGFKLGFGGTLTYDRSEQIRRLAQSLPLESIVLETDAPDIPPNWLYVTAKQRAAGIARQKNTPIELPQIGACLAKLRGVAPDVVARQTTVNVERLLRRFPLDEPRPADF